MAWPNASKPQQATEPLLLTPQVWRSPALTETKEPAGGVALPYSSLPQQATEPLLLTPQVWPDPALTESKEPAGGAASPSPFQPQQATEPLLFTPQEWTPPALTETKGIAGGGVGVGVSVGRGVDVGSGVGVGYGVAVVYGVAVGRGVFVGPGVEVGHGVFVGRGVAVSIGVGLGAEVVKIAATFASTVASIAVSASRVPRTPASTVAGTSGVGRDAVCVSAGDGASLVQATAVRPKITKTIRMIILIFFLQCRETFQSSLSTGSEATGADRGELPGRRPHLTKKPQFPRPRPILPGGLSLPLLLFSGVRSTPLYAPVLFDLGTESIPAVKLGDSNGVSISCIFEDGDFITLYSDACSYR